MGDRAKPTQKPHPHPPPRRGPGDRTFQPHVLGLAQPSGSLCVLVTRCRTSTVGDAGMAHAGHLGTPPLAAGALGAELLCLRSLTGVWNNPGVPVGVVLGVGEGVLGPGLRAAGLPSSVCLDTRRQLSTGPFASWTEGCWVRLPPGTRHSFS